MKKVILCGLRADRNFGCPSLLHGMETLLQEYHCEILNIQLNPVEPVSVSDFGFQTISFAINMKKLLPLTLLYRMGVRAGAGTPERKLLDTLSGADCIIDLFGICFCDNFEKDRHVSGLYAAKRAISKFPIPFCGKLLGIKTLKNTSSYGPMRKEASWKTARFADRYIFDCFIAREAASQKEMLDQAQARKPVLLAPDTANLMPVPAPLLQDRPIVISVSYQIIRQWGAEESYIDAMCSLCRTIVERTGRRIVLLPNEILTKTNDITIAEELARRLEKIQVATEVVDVCQMNSSQIKSVLTSAEAVIASRYHSCVAALSAGIPLFIIGWHNKYQELAELYGQQNWIVSGKECSTEILSTRFLDFWDHKDQIREELQSRKPEIEHRIRQKFSEALQTMGIT